MAKIENIPIGKSQIVGFRAKDNYSVYQDISLYDNVICYATIGSKGVFTTYKYSKSVLAEHEPFYSTSQTLDKVLIDFDKTLLAKDGDYLDIEWLVKIPDPLNVGNFLYEPVDKQTVGIFRKNLVSSELP